MKVKKDLLKGWKRSVSNLINVEEGDLEPVDRLLLIGIYL
jgi:hypothetical protein